MAGSHYSPSDIYELPVLEGFFGDVPHKSAIGEARNDVMTVILEEFPESGARTILRASDVAERLRLRGHTLAASLFGIRERVLSGDLFVLPTNPDSDEPWRVWCDVNLFVSNQWNSTQKVRSGQFGLIVDGAKRTIRRQGFAECVNLETTGVLWLIFDAVWDANGEKINNDRFKSRYTANGHSWGGRFNAVNRLNKLLKPIRVRIEKMQLKEIAKP
jgi:hypothetical protein